MVIVRELFRTQISKINLFIKRVNCFQEKSASCMFEYVLNKFLTIFTHREAWNIATSKFQKLPRKCKKVCLFCIYCAKPP